VEAAVAPTSVLYAPAWHDGQEADPGLLEYFPVVHVEQVTLAVAAKAGLKVPDWHKTQVVEAVAFTAELYEPVWHEVQEPNPILLEYFPDSQVVQVKLLTAPIAELKVPISHLAQVEEAEAPEAEL
jgi:hypothetical protein